MAMPYAYRVVLIPSSSVDGTTIYEVQYVGTTDAGRGAVPCACRAASPHATAERARVRQHRARSAHLSTGMVGTVVLLARTV